MSNPYLVRNNTIDTPQDIRHKICFLWAHIMAKKALCELCQVILSLHASPVVIQVGGELLQGKMEADCSSGEPPRVQSRTENLHVIFGIRIAVVR